MTVVYRTKQTRLAPASTLAAAPARDPAFEKRLADAGVDFDIVEVAGPVNALTPGVAASGARVHAADLLPPGPRVIYFRKIVGQYKTGPVLAVLIERDPAYERQLDRAGELWDVHQVDDHTKAPRHDEMQRATLRDGLVQLDREDVVH